MKPLFRAAADRRAIYSSVAPGSSLATALMARRTRSGRCGVCGQSAWLSRTMPGLSSSTRTSSPQRTRSRISQHGSQARPKPAVAASAMASRSSKRSLAFGAISSGVSPSRGNFHVNSRPECLDA
jgi:hypothetical protein